MLDDSTLRLNLSYVLHAPSGSRSVRRAARSSMWFEKNRQRILNRFQWLADEEFNARISTPPVLHDSLQMLNPAMVTVTPTVGLPQLLSRALTSITGIGHAPPILQVDRATSSSECMYVHFFRAVASLVQPPRRDSSAGAFVLALVLRPGHESLQLVGDFISEPVEVTGEGQPRWSGKMIHAIEEIVRDYADQWTAPGPLWDRPAERSLAEYTSRNTARGG